MDRQITPMTGDTHNLFQGPLMVALANVDLPFHPVYKLAVSS